MSDVTRVQQIRARVEAASRGPWESRPPGTIVAHSTQAVVKQPDNFDWVCSVQASNSPNWRGNTEFIAAAIEDVPWLLGRVDEMTKALSSTLTHIQELLSEVERVGAEREALREQLRMAQSALARYSDRENWIGATGPFGSEVSGWIGTGKGWELAETIGAALAGQEGK